MQSNLAWRWANRPAPPDVRPAGERSEVPDGWLPVHAGNVAALVMKAEIVALGMLDSAAHTITGRRFLRRLGEAGVVVGVAGSRLLWGMEISQAHTKCNACGQGDPGPCGPSEICADHECDSNGCDTSYECADPPHIS